MASAVKFGVSAINVPPNVHALSQRFGHLVAGSLRLSALIGNTGLAICSLCQYAGLLGRFVRKNTSMLGCCHLAQWQAHTSRWSIDCFLEIAAMNARDNVKPACAILRRIERGTQNCPLGQLRILAGRRLMRLRDVQATACIWHMQVQTRHSPVVAYLRSAGPIAVVRRLC